ncbi:unnamed protein product [Brachionus calyciflorus]|uniref:FYVE-type domain-containing protein n=1 Tax=Brachionus calyciflorus TaxID=104777 RepID=A0A814EDS6_9BILA|nr:unnamed protein product [Brachionus calyciflorus]
MSIPDVDNTPTLIPDDTDNPVYLRNLISDLKRAHLAELNELRNQLDEVRTRATIIETTKQDELDELKFRQKQELDSLNHIINALQGDLNSVRHEYEQLSNNFKEYKRQVQFMNSTELKSPISNSSSITNRLNLSPFGSKSNQMSINQENENLEEDMRKAKESAEMLRSVVLPLETEITNLRSRSNTSEKRIKELETIIDQQEKEKQKFLDDEQKIIDESLTNSIEIDLQNFNKLTNNNNNQNNITGDTGSIISDVDNTFFKKYIKLKKYLRNNENTFIQLQQTHLKALKQIFSILTPEQKLRLIPRRSKSKSISGSSIRSETSSKSNMEHLKSIDENSDSSDIFEPNETIVKIKELLEYLTSEKNQEDSRSIDTISSNDLSILNINNTTNNINDTLDSTNNKNNNDNVYSYVELLALYENERAYRTNYIESNFNQPSEEAKKQIEDLNKEMSNMALIIEDMKKEYLSLQDEFTTRIDELIKLNQTIQNEAKQIQNNNELYKKENYRLKVENKQFYGEKSILVKEIDEQYQQSSTLEEAQRQNINLRNELVKLILANQALQKQHALSLENIKNLQKINLQYQHSNNAQENLVIAQSLESELDRERKVREESEKEIQELRTQLLIIKEKGQSLVETLKTRNENNEFEIRKLKEENQELQNQIVTFKKDVQNSMSVQEDLVGLIQSLQIELNQTKMADSGSSNGPIEVRCQHEDDFTECTACKNVFSVTRRKHRCKHCCKIFCADCCSKIILSGPNLRQHKVCSTCHILLDKDAPNSVTN